MLSETYYLIRSKADGRYLAARPNEDDASTFVLLFRENFDALSYLNTHAGDLADRLGVETISGTQIKTVLQRWSFNGVGIVTDPLLPTIEFLVQS
ncbi:hypothetical protein Riv7116_0553 [Rivularia sp. PCC 7116]|uniref:hypothetical protein n=1 Tax=Rivularia sp. PCC 7116 TaxID=373994 RepID=UPI00029F1202|nr:hypothetical protein [Rivularia sp. PCC 7116]AFY53148.1 hypothetical protein Riv7116_0553 [Rivularia sp. PCC 7116]